MRRYYIGIDEVGRGALAGPVYAAAVLSTNTQKILNGYLIRDSKKLSQKQREDWYKFLDKKFVWGLGKISERLIDKIGIEASTFLAMEKALLNLLKKKRVNLKHTLLLIDGNRLPNSKLQKPINKMGSNFKDTQSFLEKPLMIKEKQGISKNHRLKTVNYKLIIKGDEKIPLISAASILAKVSRDEFLMKKHSKYPYYNWLKNKGYGTKEHFQALIRYGSTKFHRQSFLKKPPYLGR